MPSVLSVSVDSDDLDRDVEFWEAVLGVPPAVVLTWAPGAGSAFFELTDGVRLIVNAPMRGSQLAEWLGLELEISHVESTHDRLKASGIAVSDVYDTDGGSRAVVVTAPNGQKFRMGTRWELPAGETDLTGGAAPKERELS